MAYAQWVTITIYATNFDVTLVNVAHSWGKFYDSDKIGYAGGNKDNEYQPSAIEGKVIKANSSFSINACGREDAASGTEGSFELYDGNTQVGTYSWDCPWGSKTNSSTWSSSGPQPPLNKYVTSQTGANLDSGALGTVTIQTTKIA
ncbi:MAG: aegerolysin family protein [Microcystis sp. M54BS1]|uniref:aegerolysin family protein n=1 Tax=unclassified Microcystis TaxID=2643300 RepID=UPI00257AEBC9|nr:MULTISPECIES: aegerolysin family protein [unclassified Microcystis]MCA2541724.1 aegerolysin family protein [Microcystis sp. M54BS1]MCA2593772.1 aegerolysin family protein [Microcystis sp. M38BS1]MCA2609912.1 aegerolysin family protein [Microcystis sp. M27BS1]MCA2507352.1 aegerolysin family protein [Microcystis sp. M62BS1]MCA2512293.1 aegerolysin family protein [Microcystis sp. M60BS1]